MLLLFESNEMSYFDGLEKVYSDDLIDKLIVVGIVILVLALLSGFLFTEKNLISNGHPPPQSDAFALNSFSSWWRLCLFNISWSFLSY
jgi:uncharacterized membrane protein YqhA